MTGMGGIGCFMVCFVLVVEHVGFKVILILDDADHVVAVLINADHGVVDLDDAEHGVADLDDANHVVAALMMLTAWSALF